MGVLAAFAAVGGAGIFGPVIEQANAYDPVTYPVKRLVVQINPNVVNGINSAQDSAGVEAPATGGFTNPARVTFPTSGLIVRGRRLLRSTFNSKGQIFFIQNQPSALPFTVSPTRTVVKGSAGTSFAVTSNGSRPINGFDVKGVKVRGRTISGTLIVSSALGNQLNQNFGIPALNAGQQFGTFKIS